MTISALAVFVCCLAAAIIFVLLWVGIDFNSRIRLLRDKLGEMKLAISYFDHRMDGWAKQRQNEIAETARAHKRIEQLEDRVAVEQKLQLDLAGGGVWQTQSGYKLRIRDMSTNHLQNTLKLFKARASRREPFLSMQRELARRAEDKVWQQCTEEAKKHEEKIPWTATFDDKLRQEHAAECKAEEDAMVAASDPWNRLDAWLKERMRKGKGFVTIQGLRRKIGEIRRS